MLSLKAREAVWRKFVQARRRRVKRLQAKPRSQARSHALKKARFGLKRAEDALAKIRRQIAERETPLRVRALGEAERLIGVMEQGGNNRGQAVEKIIREGGGLPGQAWCGWFCAAVYRRAGSKAVTWHWGAVRLLWPLSGVSRTSSPQAGDMVRFTFDHVGLFVKDLGGSIQTIEGNTGAAGAVSDSATGGDGVYRKTRSKTLVSDYLKVTR